VKTAVKILLYLNWRTTKYEKVTIVAQHIAYSTCYPKNITIYNISSFQCATGEAGINVHDVPCYYPSG